MGIVGRILDEEASYLGINLGYLSETKKDKYSVKTTCVFFKNIGRMLGVHRTLLNCN